MRAGAQDLVFQPDKTVMPGKEGEWTLLLDKELSQWRSYQSFEMKNDYNGSIPTDENGEALIPIGYDQNVKNVFSTLEEEGETILRISGEIYGCVFTKEDFKNYHLKLKMKWGDKKWVPRLDKELDSGILYHSQGECGVDYWRSWMLSHEFQIMEGGCGDYWTISSAQIELTARPVEERKFIFDPAADIMPFGAGTPNWGYCAINKDAEKPKGEWNDIELICYNGKSLHIVNGKVVMAISALRCFEEGITRDLDEGKLQLQSEAGEVFYKDIRIKPINNIPEEYMPFFNRKN